MLSMKLIGVITVMLGEDFLANQAILAVVVSFGHVVKMASLGAGMELVGSCIADSF